MQKQYTRWLRAGMGLVLAVPALALANPDLESKIANSKNWAMQAGDFSNKRYSKLKQINKGNVKDRRWPGLSTGVLRGHEGGPLVVGDTLYVHSPFPNKVFAINLKDQRSSGNTNRSRMRPSFP